VLPARVLGGLDPDGLRFGFDHGGLRRAACIPHRVEDDVASCDGSILTRLLDVRRVGRRVVVACRHVDQAGEEGALGERELGDVLPEVGAGGRLHAVGAPPEIGRVQVSLEDLTFGRHALEADREDRLGPLAPHGSGLAVEVEVLRELLRDGRATFAVAFGEVVEQRAGRPAQVDRTVLVEAPVLDRDDGVLHRLRDPRQRDGIAVDLTVQVREQRPVRGKHLAGHGRPEERARVVVGRQRGGDAERSAREQEDEYECGTDDGLEPTVRDELRHPPSPTPR
jgi:hypothetical protein